MSTLETLTARVSGAVGENCGLGRTMKFDFGNDGAIFIDAKTVPNVVDNRADKADCNVAVKFTDFVAIAEGRMDSMMAFMQGKMKVSGDMTVAQRLTPILKRI